MVVVGAAILDGERRLLAAQRRYPERLAGGWELPGGKVEAGESDEFALLRECQEELGVVIRLMARVGGDWPLGTDAILRVWTAEVIDGVPVPLSDHAQLRWLPPDEWFDVRWLTADLPVIAAVRRELGLST